MPARGRKLEAKWYDSLHTLANSYPDLAMELRGRVQGKFSSGREQALKAFPVETKDIPIRQFSGQVYDFLFEKVPFIAGSADLSDPNNLFQKAKVAFGSPQDDLANVAKDG